MTSEALAAIPLFSVLQIDWRLRLIRQDARLRGRTRRSRARTFLGQARGPHLAPSGRVCGKPHRRARSGALRTSKECLSSAIAGKARQALSFDKYHRANESLPHPSPVPVDRPGCYSHAAQRASLPCYRHSSPSSPRLSLTKEVGAASSKGNLSSAGSEPDRPQLPKRTARTHASPPSWVLRLASAPW